MTNKEQIAHDLLPRVEGLLLGTIAGLEIENLNREGAAKTLTAAIAILHKVRLLLDMQPNSETGPHLQQTDCYTGRQPEPLPPSKCPKCGHEVDNVIHFCSAIVD